MTKAMKTLYGVLMVSSLAVGCRQVTSADEERHSDDVDAGSASATDTDLDSAITAAEGDTGTDTDADTDADTGADAEVDAAAEDDTEVVGTGDTGDEDDTEIRITDSTDTAFLRQCSDAMCSFVPDSPTVSLPACVDACQLFDGPILLLCGVMIDGDLTSIPWHQCRPVTCREPDDCPSLESLKSYHCVNDLCQGGDADDPLDSMTRFALCANELPRENECGMIWSNETYRERISDLNDTCPDPELETCALPDSCLQP